MPGINNVLSSLEAYYRGQVNGKVVGFAGGVASLVAAHPTMTVLSDDVLAASANCGGCTALGCGGDGVDLAALLGDDAAAANAAQVRSSFLLFADYSFVCSSILLFSFVM